MRFKKSALFLLIVLVSAAGVPGQNTTCGCYSSEPLNLDLKHKVEYNLKHSKAVFSGKVISITEIPSGASKGNLEVGFEAAESWKKVRSKLITVMTQRPGKVINPPYTTSCGYEFSLGESYLVYVERISDSFLYTGICSRTRKLDESDEDIAILGRGKSIHR